jgi:hypothetical protein
MDQVDREFRPEIAIARTNIYKSRSKAMAKITISAANRHVLTEREKFQQTAK